MEDIAFFVVQWLVVPCIMIALFIYARAIVRALSERESKTSANAGFWAGLIILAIFVISQLDAIRNFQFSHDELQELLVLPMMLGAIVGFVFMHLVRLVIPTRLVGLLTLVLSATSSSALFSYVFMNNLRVILLHGTLGIALGSLLYIVLFPAAMRSINKMVG
ncbi:MAG: hypothetical protein RMN52_06770 [Anaerolineae bacterium]|nr:hypothetical protein [Candidatus Roseilinea sp.]MDW8449689.1 hypothetical protein [Anaerolineae bacterium]